MPTLRPCLCMSPLLCVCLFSGVLLLPAAASAQTTYNHWDARPPQPLAKPARPAAAPKPTAPAAVVIPSNSLSPTSSYQTSVEQMPVFPGGQEALLGYIKSRLKRPRGPRVAGMMYVTYTVLASGAVANARVVPGRGLSSAYDAAVVEVEVINGISSFSPGKRNGGPADMEVTIPVRFPM